MKIQIFLSLLLITSEVLASASDCSRREDPLAHLSGIARLTCERALAAGYSLEETGCARSTNVAWHTDRDNSMVDANNKVGRAMGIVRTRKGTSQAIQVCPGVYLASAHGVLDDPSEGEVHPPSSAFSVFAYPISSETRMSSGSDSNFTSPRLRNPSAWEDPSTDYVFVKVDKPVRPDDYIEPLNYEYSDLLEASNSGDVDVYLYRGKSKFQTDSQGYPVVDQNGRFDNSRIISGNALVDVYDVPQRVRRECQLGEELRMGISWHNCPVEPAVSGSPSVVANDGTHYLVGTAHGGLGAITDKPNATHSLNINSSAFCSDYENVCGKPCAEFQEVFPNGRPQTSI